MDWLDFDDRGRLVTQLLLISLHSLASGLTDLAKIWLSARLPFDSGQ